MSAISADRSLSFNQLGTEWALTVQLRRKLFCFGLLRTSVIRSDYRRVHQSYEKQCRTVDPPCKKVAGFRSGDQSENDTQNRADKDYSDPKSKIFVHVRFSVSSILDCQSVRVDGLLPEVYNTAIA